MSHIPMSVPDRIGAIIDHPGWLHQFNHHAREVLNETGSLPNTPIWDYLHHRRDLAPARFDAFHPFWRKLFRDESKYHPVAPTIPVAPVQPPPFPVVIQPPPLPGMVPAVPEPSSWIVMGLAIVIVGGYAFAMTRKGSR